MTPKEKLAELGYEITTPAKPAANYEPVQKIGNTLFVSGQVSAGPDGVIKGLLGDNMDVAQGQKAAARSAVAIFANLAATDGVDLAKIRIVKLTVLVASKPDFFEQHLVANGASDLIFEVLGDKGKHARAAFGVASLPLGAAVEIEAVVEVTS